MVSDRPIAVTAASEAAWRRRRARWRIVTFLLMPLAMLSVIAVIGTPMSTAGTAIRRFVPLQVPRGGSSFQYAAVSYTVLDNGAIIHDEHGFLLPEAALAGDELVTGLHVTVTGTRSRHGFWALTQETLRFRVDVASVFPEHTPASEVDAIMDRAMPAIVEDFLQNAPDWWFQRDPAVHAPFTSRILWSGWVQNLATLFVVVLIPLAITKWLHARSVHQRLHAIVVKQACPKCGYSLIGKDGSRCPECGEHC